MAGGNSWQKKATPSQLYKGTHEKSLTRGETHGHANDHVGNHVYHVTLEPAVQRPYGFNQMLETVRATRAFTKRWIL